MGLPELKGETNSDRYNCYVVEKPKKGCVSGNGKEIGRKKECEYLKDLFLFLNRGKKPFCLEDWRMKRHRQHSDRMCLCMTSVSVSQSKYNKIWKCECLASTSGPFERSPLMSYHF